MHILILSLYYSPELTSNAPLVTALAEQFAKGGMRVTVVAGTPHLRLSEVPERYRNRLFVRENIGGVDVVRAYAHSNTTGVVPKVLNYLTFLSTSFFAGIRAQKPDVVMAISPPFLLGFSAWLLSRIRGAKAIYNAQDLFPDSYISSGLVNPGRLTRLMQWLHTSVLRICDAITVITPRFKKRMEEQGIPEAKIRVIPNFADLEKIVPLAKENSFSRAHHLYGHFVIEYAGNLGFTHGPEMLVDVAARLQHIDDLRVLIVGEGSGKPCLLERLRQNPSVQNVVLLPVQDSETLRELLATADIGLVTTKPGVAHASFPSRIYNLMSAGRPIVAAVDLDSDAADLINAAKCGICVPPGDSEAFAVAVERLYKNPADRVEMGISGRKFLSSRFHVEAVAGEYYSLFANLLNKWRS